MQKPCETCSTMNKSSGHPFRRSQGGGGIHRDSSDYYQNNIGGTANLLEAMNEHGVKNIVFSSSCTVYGRRRLLPLHEDFPLQAVNPYGQTKLTIEYMLKDLALPTRTGTFRSCVISTRLARTPAVKSARTRWAFPTT